MCSPSQNSCTSSPQQTGAYFPPPPRLHAPSDVLLVSRHLQLHLPPQVRAHEHGSSKPSVTGVFSVCFPRQQKTTDLPRARTTCCAGRHIWPHAWSSSESPCPSAKLKRDELAYFKLNDRAEVLLRGKKQ